MTDEPKKSRPKVVTLCGTEVKPADLPADPESVRARDQLHHWADRCSRYVALFISPDGEVRLCSSAEGAGEVMRLAVVLDTLARDLVMGEYDELDDEPEGAA